MGRHTLIQRLALAVALLTLASCEPAELGGRFAAEILLAGKSSPRKPTRLRFFPTGDELLITSREGRVHHFRLGED